MENINNLTDEQLKKELLNSYIDDAQKNSLSPLIGNMTQEERLHLMELIQESQQEYESIQSEGIDSDALAKINEKTNKEIENLTKESVDQAFDESEKLENDQKGGGLKELEKEINQVETNLVDNSSKNVTLNREQLGKERHSTRNFLLIFAFIVLIVVGAFVALKYL